MIDELLLLLLLLLLLSFFYAEAAQYTAAVKQTKTQYTDSVCRTEIFSAVTCSMNKIFSHARLDIILNKILRWSVVFGQNHSSLISV